MDRTTITFMKFFFIFLLFFHMITGFIPIGSDILFTYVLFKIIEDE
jgi:hypothetical protein